MHLTKPRIVLAILFALLSAVCVTCNDDLTDQLGNGTTTSSPAPSFAPSANSTSNVTVSPAPSLSPAPTTHNETTVSPAPSLSPAPTVHNQTDSPAPSTSPAPTTHNETESPSPTHAPNTTAPTDAPAPDNHHHHHHHYHIWKILYKTVAWMLVAGLFLLAFGACMSNRYRIYYYLRGSWYRLLRSDCVQWVLRKTRLDGFFLETGAARIITV